MSATISARYFMARGASAFLNYLHVDLAIVALVLAFFFAGGLTRNIDAFQAVELAMARSPTMAEAATPMQVMEHASHRLVPAMEAALDQVAQRYRVSPEALLPVFAAAQAAGREWRLDPLLIIAVISIESRFNPFSQSPVGAQGLMQIIPRYHQEKLPKDADSRAFFDPVTNVQIGARILREAILRQGSLTEGLQYYAGAMDDAEQTYANKVIAEKTRLEQAPRRREGANA